MAAHQPSMDSGPSSKGLSLPPRTNSDRSSGELSQVRLVNEHRPSQELQEKQPDATVIELASNENEGESKKIGWVKNTILLIVEAIALGCLSIPYAFAQVGMIGGVVLTVGIGIICIFTSYLVGLVKIKNTLGTITDYPTAVRLFGGNVGYWICSSMYILFLALVNGSHVLTGTIALNKIFATPRICALLWGCLTLFFLFLGALPRTFSKFAWLGYLDVISILAAIFTVIVDAGYNVNEIDRGLAAVEWSYLPPDDMTFHGAFLAATNIIFAYSFSVCQYALMAEMHTPKDYMKSIYTLGSIEIVLYTGIGATLYGLLGENVKDLALLSAGPTNSRIAFALAIPVIFISGSINTTVAGKYIMEGYQNNRRARLRRVERNLLERLWERFAEGPLERHVKSQSKRDWIVWTGIIAALSIFAWVIAEAVPFFNGLLGIISSLFISGFSFYFPALFWFCVLMEGKWYQRKNILWSILCGGIFIIGIVILVAGTYSSVEHIRGQYQLEDLRAPFTCNATAYN